MARIELECRRCGWKTVTSSVERMKEWDAEHDAECPELRRAAASENEATWPG